MSCVQASCAWHIYANVSKIRYECFRESSLYADSAWHSPGETLHVPAFTSTQLACRKSPLPLGNLVQHKGTAAGPLHPLLSVQCGQSLEANLHPFFAQSLRLSLHPFHHAVYFYLIIVLANSPHLDVIRYITCWSQ